MFSLEDQIDIYTDEQFNASNSAQHFFTSFSETEISKKRSDMTKIQQQIEMVLKQNVRNKYTDFLIATDQINQVGHEMIELKQLIENTQKLIEDARTAKASNDFKATKNPPIAGSKDSIQSLGNTNTSTTVDRNAQAQKKFEEIKSERKAAAQDASVPSWLLRAPDDVAQYIVEQQYQKAVAVVIKTRSYVEGLKKLKSSNPTEKQTPGRGGSLTANEKAFLALEYVNERAAHLAVTIKKSLTLLPNSPLWGMQELFKRLKLLIALNEYKFAAEGFAQIKEQSIQSAIFSVEITSDTNHYCMELSRIFYQELSSASITYHQLFDEQKDNPEITGLLLQWIQTQISVYVQMLVRQICFAVNDATTVLIVHLKDANNYSKQPASNSINNAAASMKNAFAPPSPAEDSSKGLSGAETPKKKRILFRAESTMTVPDRSTSNINISTEGAGGDESNELKSLRTTNNSSSSRLFQRTNTATSAVPNTTVLISGIPILIKCLHVIFQAAVDHQNNASSSIASSSPSSAGTAMNAANQMTSEKKAKAIPVYPILIYFLMPQIKSLLYSYTDDLCKEISSQVRQDSWNFLKAPSLTVKILSNIERSNNVTRLNTAFNLENAVDNDHPSNSPESLKMVSLSYIWMVAVFNIFTEDIYHLLNSVKSNNYHLRNDFAEIEPMMATCLLRILLRYIVEIEAVDYTSLSRIQQECFHSTNEAIVYYLVPSIQKIMEDYFYIERLSLLSNPPNVVNKTIMMRLFRILNEVESSLATSN